MTNAIIVGSGPNGLAAALVMAKAGVEVTVIEAEKTLGGGARSGELTLPGLIHDHCSAVHPLGVASPLFGSDALARHGLRWKWAEIDLAHPFDDRPAAVLTRSMTDSAASLGADGTRWRRLFEPLAADIDRVLPDVLEPLVGRKRNPVALARFGLVAALPAMTLARLWREPAARALFGGMAGHSIRPLHMPLTSAIGLTLAAVGHRYGWPVVEGGSQAITDALASWLRQLGATMETGRRVESIRELPRSDVVMLDLAPSAAATLLDSLLPDRTRRAYQRYRHGPGVVKLDLAVDGGVPWRDERCRSAGFVHVGGTLEEIANAESEIHRGRMPERPFVLVAQQYLADPSRSHGSVHPVWAYAHVPRGYPHNATEPILKQLERFAPGLRERVLSMVVRDPADLQRYNANYVGGDILCGANSVRQILARPRLIGSPYRTGVPGVYLCSAATPPGAGVHGMCGVNAANTALRDLETGRAR